MNTFLNVLIAYLKSLLFPEIHPGFLQPSLRALYLYFNNYSVFKDLDEDEKPYGKNGIRLMEKFLKYAEGLRELYSDQALTDLSQILKFPADTRPGANTSSLLIHSMASSGVSCSIFLEKARSAGISVNKREHLLAVLRLACLFHDIGKMVDWARHEEKSSEILLEIFRDYVDGEAREIVSEAAKLIKGEGLTGGEELFLRDLLKEGDVRSSAVDRVAKIFRSVMEGSQPFKKLEEKLEEFSRKRGERIEYERAYNDWRFWDHVGKDLVRELTEEFCRRASTISNETFEKIKDTKPGKLYPDSDFVRIDCRKIQSYIRVNDIWAMNGASREVDFILYVGVPVYIVEKLGIPLESILYFGGGNLTLVLPKSSVDLIDGLCNHFNDVFFKGTPSSLIYGRSAFYDTFFSINSEIDWDLARKKHSLNTEGFPVDPNIYARCEICGISYAEAEKKGKLVCKNCSRKLDLGENNHFRVRADALKLDWEKMKEYVIEYIAGHSEEGVKPEEKQLNYALVKFDGNLVGQLMSSSISITDACERSFRIDSSVKIAIRTFLESLKSLNEDDFKRFALGLMYVGGDDGVILMPSYLALPFAIHLLNEYYLNMGCKNSLSVGMLATKPKHPLINSIESAGELLRTAKDSIRKLAYSEVHGKQVYEPSRRFRGALSFFVADTGWVTSETISEVLEEMYEDGFSRMEKSYILSDSKMDDSILRLAEVVDDSYSNLNGIDVKKLVEITKKYFEDTSGLKKIRDAIHDVFSSSNIEKVDKIVYLIYMIKESSSAPDNEKRELMRRFLRNLVVDNRERILLQDLYLLVKLIGGGKL